MRRPYYPWDLSGILTGRPSLGSMLDLCDENYALLMRMAPGLVGLRNRHVCRVEGGMDLFMEIRGQTPYTSLIRLTYRFEEAGAMVDDPAALLRAYHDAHQLEVIEMRQLALPLVTRPDMTSLERKWRLNLFLSKWLGHCCQMRYRFDNDSEHCGRRQEVATCR
jgi:uncharacterized protein YqiB (DUF1249 family)